MEVVGGRGYVSGSDDFKAFLLKQLDRGLTQSLQVYERVCSEPLEATLLGCASVWHRAYHLPSTDPNPGLIEGIMIFFPENNSPVERNTPPGNGTITKNVFLMWIVFNFKKGLFSLFLVS